MYIDAIGCLENRGYGRPRQYVSHVLKTDKLMTNPSLILNYRCAISYENAQSPFEHESGHGDRTGCDILHGNNVLFESIVHFYVNIAIVLSTQRVNYAVDITSTSLKMARQPAPV